MQGRGLIQDLRDHVRAISDENGHEVTIIHEKPRSGGAFLMLRGDGNPWEVDDEQEDILCHKNEANQSLHFGTGRSGDWHYVYVSRDENSPNGAGSFERQSTIHLWISANEDLDALTEARRLHAEYAIEGVQEFLLMGSWLLRHIDQGKFLTPGIEKSLIEYNRKAARL